MKITDPDPLDTRQARITSEVERLCREMGCVRSMTLEQGAAIAIAAGCHYGMVRAIQERLRASQGKPSAEKSAHRLLDAQPETHEPMKIRKTHLCVCRLCGTSFETSAGNTHYCAVCRQIRIREKARLRRDKETAPGT